MAKTYTAHALNEPMLHRLTMLASRRPAMHHHGHSMRVLDRMGLVDGFNNVPGCPCCTITDAGRDALADARAEGWE